MKSFRQFCEDTALSPREITKTPEFKRWFDQSKVVDDHGQPHVMYHGTHRTGEITKFKGFRGYAGHFAFTPAGGNQYTDFHMGPETEEPREGLIPVYLFAKSIFDLADKNHRAKVGIKDFEIHNDTPYITLEKYANAIEMAGFDAVYDYERGIEDGPDGIAVFKPEQIKSALGNRTFDPTSPHIHETKK